MKHKTLEQLYQRIEAADTPAKLQRIDNDCGWDNCALGTFLREKSIVDLSKSIVRGQVVHALVKPQFFKKGCNFNKWLITGKKDEALGFIRELQLTSISGILKR